MDRRDWLTQLSALGAGIAAASTCEAGQENRPSHQPKGPMALPHLHFCGIHMAKKNPKVQFVTQHYCVAAGEGLHQCLLYDSTSEKAKLIGIEYLVTDEIYRRFPDEEKKYWHPHTYEVLGGGLIAPGMSQDDENKFMSYIMTTWGKAWHTWPDLSTPVPMGEPLLIWSLMADGQADAKVVAARDKDFSCNTDAIRDKRIKHFKMDPPHVGLPKSMDSIGRQWTDSGDDKPPKKN